ncbi:hypothetical protein gpAD87_03345 [Paenibacillus sp. AD87]|nr:hypothetical protein gpAD87_03345 [Paenibacillus sp. AD87]
MLIASFLPAFSNSRHTYLISKQDYIEASLLVHDGIDGGINHRQETL